MTTTFHAKRNSVIYKYLKGETIPKNPLLTRLLYKTKRRVLTLFKKKPQLPHQKICPPRFNKDLKEKAPLLNYVLFVQSHGTFLAGKVSQ